MMRIIDWKLNDSESQKIRTIVYKTTGINLVESKWVRMNGCTFGQDQDSSVVRGMPEKTFDIGGIDQQVSFSNISQKIVDFGEERLT